MLQLGQSISGGSSNLQRHTRAACVMFVEISEGWCALMGCMLHDVTSIKTGRLVLKVVAKNQGRVTKNKKASINAGF